MYASSCATSLRDSLPTLSGPRLAAEVGRQVCHRGYVTHSIEIPYNFSRDHLPSSYPSFAIRCPWVLKTVPGRIEIKDRRDYQPSADQRCGAPSSRPPLSLNDDRATASNAHAWRAERSTIEPNRRARRLFQAKVTEVLRPDVFPLHPARVGILALGERAGEARLQQGIVKSRLTAVSDAQHGRFTTGSSPVFGGRATRFLST